ncbi:MAG: TfoX/Sxy family protein [Tabrizicola sp.]|nr:TfoX/Sxy family protein [Tabrizicola sp.]
MAYDPGLAELMRGALAEEPFTETKMFGGIAFMLHGHMLCGLHKGGVMVRVGKENYEAALALNGVAPMLFTGRAMVGMVDVSDAAVADDALRGKLLDMALASNKAMPPKTPKPPKVAKPKKG